MKTPNTPRRGFSLIELVIVVVIIAIIAAIAIPKMSRAASGAAESALIQDLSQVRAAIDMYAAEHGGSTPSATTATTFTDALTKYSDPTGAISTTKGSGYIYGPYLKAIPPMPLGSNKGLTNITVTGPAGTTTGFAWLYDGTTFYANNPSSETDGASTAKAYNTY